MFSNWHVMKTIENSHRYFHGDLSEYDPWDLEDMVEVPESEYTAEDILFLTDLVASDNGLGNMSFVYDSILEILRKVYCSNPEKEKEFAKEFSNLVYRNF